MLRMDVFAWVLCWEGRVEGRVGGRDVDQVGGGGEGGGGRRGGGRMLGLHVRWGCMASAFEALNTPRPRRQHPPPSRT